MFKRVISTTRTIQTFPLSPFFFPYKVRKSLSVYFLNTHIFSVFLSSVVATWTIFDIHHQHIITHHSYPYSHTYMHVHMTTLILWHAYNIGDEVDEGKTFFITSPINTCSIIHLSSPLTLTCRIESPTSHTHTSHSYMTWHTPSSTYYRVCKILFWWFIPPPHSFFSHLIYFFHVYPIFFIIGHTRASLHPHHDPLILLLSHTTSTTVTHMKNEYFYFFFSLSLMIIYWSHYLFCDLYIHIYITHSLSLHYHYLFCRTPAHPSHIFHRTSSL